jgi:hypothetical protein
MSGEKTQSESVLDEIYEENTSSSKINCAQALWYTPVIPPTQKIGQKDHGSRPAWAKL